MSSSVSLEITAYFVALALLTVGTIAIVGVTTYCLCFFRHIPKQVSSERRRDAKEIHDTMSEDESSRSSHVPEEDLSQMYEDLWSYAMVSRFVCLGCVSADTAACSLY